MVCIKFESRFKFKFLVSIWGCIKEAKLIRNIGTLAPLGMNHEDNSNYKNT